MTKDTQLLKRIWIYLKGRTIIQKMNPTKSNILFILAILFAVWFMAGGIFWVYWFAVIFAYPFGIASLALWLYLKKDGRKRNRAIPKILIAGLLLSLSMLLPWILDKWSVDGCF